jgi:hypothetical protein
MTVPTLFTRYGIIANPVTCMLVFFSAILLCLVVNTCLMTNRTFNCRSPSFCLKLKQYFSVSIFYQFSSIFQKFGFFTAGSMVSKALKFDPRFFKIVEGTNNL